MSDLDPEVAMRRAEVAKYAQVRAERDVLRGEVAALTDALGQIERHFSRALTDAQLISSDGSFGTDGDFAVRARVRALLARHTTDRGVVTNLDEA